MGWLMILAVLQATPDTVVVSASDALARALERSPVVEAAALDAEAAAFRAEQAGAWGNPSLAVSAENLGSEEEFTGVSGVEGLEGQIVLSAGLPVGGDRGSRIRYERALADEARAGAAVVRADRAVVAVQAIASAIRDRAWVETAREELATLDRLAEALQLQATEGRASRGDAARADLARGMAATRLARRLSGEAESSEELARLLGLPPGTPVAVETGVCAPSAPADESPLSDLLRADARVQAAQAGVDRARALRIPDLQPQLGVRRTGANSGLYLGVVTTLPLFDFGGRGVDAARASRAAADRLREDLTRRLDSERSAARRAVEALEEAGRRFSLDWQRHLEEAVMAAEARYELGEGTLYELLDNRRARLAALDDWWQWRADWWVARARRARLEGRPVSEFAPCTAGLGEGS